MGDDMTTEAAAREKLRNIVSAANSDYWRRAQANGTAIRDGRPAPYKDSSITDVITDAILAAFPILSLAPGKDVVEGARECVVKWAQQCQPPGDYGNLAGIIAAALTAHAAREREACCAAICYGCRLGWERGYHPLDEGRNTLLMHKAEGSDQFGHLCHAAAIRARKP